MSQAQSDPQILHLFTDGGARGNPGPAASAFIIARPSGSILFQGSRYIGETTNNVAEYQALIDALEWLTLNQSSFTSPHRPLQLKCTLDSTLVVNQLQGNYKVKKPHLIPLIQRIHTLLASLQASTDFIAVPRHQNQAADALVNQALDLHQ